jgi:hypothetical protein
MKLYYHIWFEVKGLLGNTLNYFFYYENFKVKIISV